MKIHIGFDGQTFESTRREENSSQESLGPKLSEVLVTTNVANSFLTLVNCFESQGTIALFEAENLVHEAIVLRSPKQGIIISTSGSQGERRWIFHPWSNLIKRIQSLPPPKWNNAIFLSLAHAAGIENFFRHYMNDKDVGVYSPACSPLDAFQALEAQKAEALSTTPSTFLRFISYPRLKSWIIQNLKLISLGGEEISDELMEILRREFSHIEIQSVFGTTETWSVATLQGNNLQYHIPNDTSVQMTTREGKLVVSTPYLFTHFWNGVEFVSQSERTWSTGDEVIDINNQQFRIEKNIFKKYHGLKIYPQEWEKHLKKTFNLPWLQVLEKENREDHNQSFIGVLPISSALLLPEIQNLVKEKNWPIFKWLYQAGPLVTPRGKIDQAALMLFSGKELKNIIAGFSRLPNEVQFLEPLTWEDEEKFQVFHSERALVFYVEHPYRKVVQFISKSETDLYNLLGYIPNDYVIKLPVDFDLNLSGWSSLGCYQAWEMNLKLWIPAVPMDHSWSQYYCFVEHEFDHLLQGPEKVILSSLFGSMAFYGQTEKGEGLCAFRPMKDSYYGIYLTNRGLPVLKFLEICSQALLFAKEMGIEKARTVVHMDNPGAEFIHEALGFKKTPKKYKVWTKKIL